MKTYQTQIEIFFKEFLLHDSMVPYTSIVGGIIGCKLVYDLSQIMSSISFKSYPSLTRFQRVEWNNRAISTIHAFYITALSIYFVFVSDLFSDTRLAGSITLQSNALSTFALGVSIGYFIVDLGMIIWFYPALGGLEYVIHHILSMVSVAYAMLTGEGQFYIYMVFISEVTTPGINLRWYLDAAGMKKSKAYGINGIFMFFAWLVARILLFMYLFYHLYLHYDQVKELNTFARVLLLAGPIVLSVMNLMWFWKIVKGLKKTLAKRE